MMRHAEQGVGGPPMADDPMFGQQQEVGPWGIRVRLASSTDLQHPSAPTWQPVISVTGLVDAWWGR